MSKINRPIHQPTTHSPQHRKPSPQEPPPALQQTPDSFLKTTIRQVYESTPLVMLCRKPELRELASQIPLIKDVADAVCPAITDLDETIQK
jgi:hypothetical protein